MSGAQVVEGQILCNLDTNLQILNNLILSGTAAPGLLGRAGIGAHSGSESTALIAAGFATGIRIFNNTLVHRSASHWCTGQAGMRLGCTASATGGLRSPLVLP